MMRGPKTHCICTGRALWLAAAATIGVLLLSVGTASAAPPAVAVCHKGQTIQVPQGALAGHLAHGDVVGACEDFCACTDIFNPVTCSDGSPTTTRASRRAPVRRGAAAPARASLRSPR